MGDVVGHGVAASATMGQLRVVLHERLAATGDLAAAIEAVDRMAQRIRGSRAATVCVVLLDPRTGALTYCTAGHPPPLVLTSSGPRYLPVTAAGPLGVGSQFPAGDDRLGAQDTLLLYTDGILERPGRDVPGSTVELARVAADIAAGRALRGESRSLVDRLTTQTLELLTRPTGHSDDITLLAAARRSPVPDLQLQLPATPAALQLARTALDDWVTAYQASEQDRVALAHAVVELVTNGCEHAQPGSDSAAVAVTAELLADGHARLSVSDRGRWREPVRAGSSASPRQRGFGLAMTASLTDHLDIDRGDTGTTVTVRRQLSRSAQLLTAGQAAPGRPPATRDQPELMEIFERPQAPSSRIAIYGPVDSSNVEELGTELDRLTMAGTRELIVDLTGVTHLASAAVAEFHRPAPGGDGRTGTLRLFAPPGSTAHHVLSLVNLPFTPTDPHLEEQPAQSETG